MSGERHRGVPGFPETLGRELRALRERRGMTRRDVVEALARNGSDIAEQTLATWERGTRRLLAESLVELCDVLGDAPEDVLHRTMVQIRRSPDPAEVRVHLPSLWASADPRLAALSRWARIRQAHGGSSPATTVLVLDRAALSRFAASVGGSPEDLARALLGVAPPAQG